MAGTAKVKYGQGAVYGSLACDFNHPELYREEYSTAPSQTAVPGIRTKTATKVHTRARQVVHSKQSIAPLSIVGLMIAAFVFVISIMAQAQLVAISSESVALQQELKALEERQDKLLITYESAFNMSDIEDYAMKSLGMQKPQADQIIYIDTSAADKAIVIADETGESFVDTVSNFISGFAAYFR